MVVGWLVVGLKPIFTLVGPGPVGELPTMGGLCKRPYIRTNTLKVFKTAFLYLKKKKVAIIL